MIIKRKSTSKYLSFFSRKVQPLGEGKEEQLFFGRSLPILTQTEDIVNICRAEFTLSRSH